MSWRERLPRDLFEWTIMALLALVAAVAFLLAAFVWFALVAPS